MKETNNRILIRPAVGEITEKKSRFIASLMPVKKEEEAEKFIDDIKKKYWDAKHNCSAFVIKTENGLITRCSDDGEPSGTAGRPMLETMQNAGLSNVVVVVTRYFGGTLLGTGGLIRAYRGAVCEALQSAETGILKEGFRMEFTVTYADVDRVLRYIYEQNLTLLQSEYEAEVRFVIQGGSESKDLVEENLQSMTCARVHIEETKPCTFVSADE